MNPIKKSLMKILSIEKVSCSHIIEFMMKSPEEQRRLWNKAFRESRERWDKQRCKEMKIDHSIKKE